MNVLSGTLYYGFSRKPPIRSTCGRGAFNLSVEKQKETETCIEVFFGLVSDGRHSDFVEFCEDFLWSNFPRVNTGWVRIEAEKDVHNDIPTLRYRAVISVLEDREKVFAELVRTLEEKVGKGVLYRSEY